MKNISVDFASVVDRIPEIIIVTTYLGEILYANKSLERQLGFSSHELISVSIEKIILEFAQDGGWQYIRNLAYIGDGKYSGETHLVGKDNNTITCSTNGFCLRSIDGKPAEFVFFFRDITIEKQITEELENKNLEMARINSELIRSNKELTRVSEVKTKFLSIASHELKTPLTSIKGYSEIILDNLKDKLSADILRMVESIDRAADRLHGVINNMLDITRIEQKRLRLKPENLDLVKTSKACIDELLQFASRRKISFDCSFESDLPLFYGDKMRIQQVFTNLFSNAIKYSPDNTLIIVKIFLEKRKHFHICIIDQGIGIDSDELEKIFDPFYEIADSVHHSTNSVRFMGGGTGLGLSIVKGIVERHGGIIWAQSEGTRQGEFPGSEFHILLPLKSGIQWDDDETQIIKINRIMETSRKKFKNIVPTNVKPTIMIIDDDREAIEITRMVLHSSFDIITADSGEEGIRMAFQNKPVLILLDLYLPGLDGCQVCRILRTQEETKDIKIIFFTAATQNDEIEQCYASGADEFIVKPFNGKEMLDKVTHLVNERLLKKS